MASQQRNRVLSCIINGVRFASCSLATKVVSGPGEGIKDILAGCSPPPPVLNGPWQGRLQQGKRRAIGSLSALPSSPLSLHPLNIVITKYMETFSSKNKEEDEYYTNLVTIYEDDLDSFLLRSPSFRLCSPHWQSKYKAQLLKHFCGGWKVDFSRRVVFSMIRVYIRAYNFCVDFKGKVAQNFWPFVFFMNRPNMNPWFTP